eukprot:m.387888 g.387888  ORF g.387888 m.387888 type:complete len:235 (+) comp21039_c1_seq3:193-897(+)
MGCGGSKRSLNVVGERPTTSGDGVPLHGQGSKHISSHVSSKNASGLQDGFTSESKESDPSAIDLSHSGKSSDNETSEAVGIVTPTRLDQESQSKNVSIVEPIPSSSQQRKESPPPRRKNTSTSLRDPRARTKKASSPSRVADVTQVSDSVFDVEVRVVTDVSQSEKAADQQHLETAAALTLAAAEARAEAERQTKKSADSVCTARAEARGLQDFLSDSQSPRVSNYNLPDDNHE